MNMKMNLSLLVLIFFSQFSVMAQPGASSKAEFTEDEEALTETIYNEILNN